MNRFLDSLKVLFASAATRLVGIDRSRIECLKREVRDLLPPLILAAEATGADGAAKRALVLEAVGKWYDEVILPIDLPGPDVIVDPMLRSAVVAVADELVDFGVHLMNLYGALKKPTA